MAAKMEVPYRPLGDVESDTVSSKRLEVNGAFRSGAPYSRFGACLPISATAEAVSQLLEQGLAHHGALSYLFGSLPLEDLRRLRREPGISLSDR